MLNRSTYFIREQVGKLNLSDNYIISRNKGVAPGRAILLLAAGLAVHTAFKEGNEIIPRTTT